MFESNLDAVTIRARLGLSDDMAPWLEELERIGPPTKPMRLPEKHEVGELFTRLGVAPEDAADIIDAWPDVGFVNRAPMLDLASIEQASGHASIADDQAQAVSWLLERCYQQLVAQVGEPHPEPRHKWPLLPEHLGAIGRLFYVYVFLETLPTIRQWHRERGISDDLSWTTLADLGEHIAIYRRIFGMAGFDVPEWMILHFRGALYRLGRLQFELWRQPPQGPDVIASGVPDPDGPALFLHIPESGGSLEPAACDESFAWARAFFAHHFPEMQYRVAWCTSWLLDPQLSEYLSPTSNIIRFQRRFRLFPGGSNADEGVMRFVFRREAPSLDELPQRTTLERATVRHLRAGHHWQWRTGWLML